MIEIDGSQGEGGGQILRTALGLSLLTGKPFRIHSVRARRDRPGLQRQHLAAVKAAADLGKADVKGASIGSGVLSFRPGKAEPGAYFFSVGSAGSATLVLQTVLPALLTAPRASTLTLEGGTHNPWAPPFDFLEKAFLPILNRMGPRVTATLERRGFYPAGGGRIQVSIEPAARLNPHDLLERGETRTTRATAVVTSLPAHIAERELRVVSERFPRASTRAVVDRDARGPGNVLTLEIESGHATEVFTGFGRKGMPAEEVANGVCREAETYLASGAPVGEHLADQLLIPFALARGGSFLASAFSKHASTNVDVIRRFLSVSVSTEPAGGGTRISIGPG